MAAGPSYTANPIINVDSTNGSDTIPVTWVQGIGQPNTSVTDTVASVVAATFTTGDKSASFPDGAYTDLVAFCADATAGALNFVQINSVATSGGTSTWTCAANPPASWATKTVYIGQQLTFASIGSTTSRKLFTNNAAAGDARAGWTIQLLGGHTETLASNLAFSRAGTAAAGPITLQGATAAYLTDSVIQTTLVRPVTTFSNNGDGFTINGYNVVKDFDLTNSNATKTASRAIVNGNTSNTPGILISGMKISAFGRGIVCDAGSAGPMSIESCYITGITGWTGVGYGILLGNNNGASYTVKGCWIDGTTGSTGGTAIGVTSTVVSNIYRVEDCILSNSATAGGAGGHGVHVAGAIAVQAWEIMTICRCVFYNNAADGYRNVAATATPYAAAQSLVENCVFSGNAGYAINFSGTITKAVLDAIGFRARDCVVANNTLGASNPASLFTGGTTKAPSFRSPTTGDFTILNGANAGVGYPQDSDQPWVSGAAPNAGVYKGSASGSDGRMSR